jgi:hypothetical protein
MNKNYYLDNFLVHSKKYFSILKTYFNIILEGRGASFHIEDMFFFEEIETLEAKEILRMSINQMFG